MLKLKKLGLLAALPVAAVMGVEMAAAQAVLPEIPTCVGQVLQHATPGVVQPQAGIPDALVGTTIIVVSPVSGGYTSHGGAPGLIGFGGPTVPGGYLCRPSKDCDKNLVYLNGAECKDTGTSYLVIPSGCGCVPKGVAAVTAGNSKVKIGQNIPAVARIAERLGQAHEILRENTGKIVLTRAELMAMTQMEARLAQLIEKLESGDSLNQEDFAPFLGTVLGFRDLDIIDITVGAGEQTIAANTTRE